jgi:ABC-type glycerol-3-phosphate transport system permease component
MRNRFPVWKQTITYVALVLLSAVFSIPFFWLLTTSFKTNENINR